MYVPLRGVVEISSLGFKQRSVRGTVRSSRANQSFLLHLPSYARNVTYTGVVGNSRTTDNIEQRLWNY